jgi:phytoene dehydrogenase-like protein
VGEDFGTVRRRGGAVATGYPVTAVRGRGGRIHTVTIDRYVGHRRDGTSGPGSVRAGRRLYCSVEKPVEQEIQVGSTYVAAACSPQYKLVIYFSLS